MTRALSISDVCDLLGVHRSTVYRLRRAEGFPAPVKITGRELRWISDEVEAWLRTRPRAERIGDDPEAHAPAA